jgi:hypothetical protein
MLAFSSLSTAFAEFPTFLLTGRLELLGRSRKR